MGDLGLHIAQIVPCTQAEGPGNRFALWFQGCPLRCPGCCNPEFLPFDGGESRLLSDVLAELEAAIGQHNRDGCATWHNRLGCVGIEGITLLGGEPLAHAAGAAALAIAARQRRLSVMVFTGYTLEQARTMGPDVEALLAHTDILVDGPYIREQPDTSRRWIGSTNQRVHFLTDRYRADDPCWRERNTLEIRVRGNEISVNGFPARQAVGLWKKPKRRAEPRKRPDAE
jgi:anaerobic ribonucleoside-triphosphate reductase activating protein